MKKRKRPPTGSRVTKAEILHLAREMSDELEKARNRLDASEAEGRELRRKISAMEFSAKAMIKVAEGSLPPTRGIARWWNEPISAGDTVFFRGEKV